MSHTNGALVEVTETRNFNAGWQTIATGRIRPNIDNGGWHGVIDHAFIYEGILTTRQLHILRDRDKEAVIGKQEGPRLRVDRSGGNLVFTWDSAGGKLYNLRSETDPSVDSPVDWPIFN